MDRQLQKIIKLVSRTGDKVVVLHDDREFVLANLDDYLNLIGEREPVADLSGRELLDKINRDIALWRESQREFESRDLDQDFAGEYLNESFDNLPKDFRAQDEIDRISENIFEPEVNSSAPRGQLPWEAPILSHAPDSPDVPDFSLSDDEADESFDDDFSAKFGIDRLGHSADLDLGEDFDFEDDYETPLAESKEFEEFKEPVAEFNDLDEEEVKIDEELKPSELPAIEAIDFDFEEEQEKFDNEKMPPAEFSFTKSPTVKFNRQDGIETKKKRINNFGYANPVDTVENENTENDYWLKLDNNNENKSNFDHIPPPPDITKL